jgi:hypothetical protein
MRRVSVLLAAAILMVGPLPASAATVSVNDPEGDAFARYDVVHVVATNNSAGISTWTTFTDLKGSGEVIEFYFGQAADIELSYGIDVWRQHGKLHVVVTKDDANGTRPHACKRATGTWNQITDVVHTFVPTSCMQGITFHPLHVLMRTSPPHALASSDEVPEFKVKRN